MTARSQRAVLGTQEWLDFTEPIQPVSFYVLCPSFVVSPTEPLASVKHY